MSNLVVHFEATYTEKHQELGFSHKDVMSYLKKTFGIDGVVNNEYSLERKNINRLSEEETERAFWKTLSVLANKRANSMCPIGKNIFSISIHGDIYLCHMNTGEDGSKIGHIAQNNLYSTPDTYSKFPTYLQGDIKDNNQCNQCWAKHFCGGCTRLWFYSEDTQSFNREPREEACLAHRELFSKALLKIGKIRKDPQAWSALLSMLKERIHYEKAD